jgi:hypothetical protein
MPCDARKAETTAVIAVMRPSLLPLTKRLCRSAETIPICDRSSKTSQLSFPNTRTGCGPLVRATGRSKCVSRLTRIDFPAPLGPTMAVCSPLEW